MAPALHLLRRPEMKTKGTDKPGARASVAEVGDLGYKFAVGSA
jgi:hypothetical protein